MALHKHWKDYTEDEIYKTIAKKCVKCPYSSGTKTTFNPVRSIVCDYIGHTGKSRGCRPEDCTHHLDKKTKRVKQSKFNVNT